MGTESKNIVNPTFTPVEKQIEVKKCTKCGKTLPIGEFSRRGLGYLKICKSCESELNGESPKFAGITSRELIDELVKRGYKGSLKKVVIKEIKL